MKIISIGRSDRCDIVIEDERISRRHALMRIYPLGKTEIVDLSQNGTWVNGVKMRPNVPFPIKRKDVVNFANVSQLDWAMVPDPMRCVRYVVLAVLALLLLAFAIFLFSKCSSNDSDTTIDAAGTEKVEQSASSQEKATPTSPKTSTPEKTPSEDQEDNGSIVQKGNTGKSLNELFPKRPNNPKPAEVEKKPKSSKDKQNREKTQKDSKKTTTEKKPSDNGERSDKHVAI